MISNEGIYKNNLPINTPKIIKKWDVNVKIFGIPNDEYEQFFTDLEEFIQDFGLVVAIGLGEESEEE